MDILHKIRRDRKDDPIGMDFDYVIYFTDSSIDAYDYCIREEMGHTIYHRFARADFEALMTIQ